jgi:hypothetical protein
VSLRNSAPSSQRISSTHSANTPISTASQVGPIQ